VSPEQLFNQLAQEADFSFDGAVFGEDAFECTYFIDVTGKRRLDVVQLRS
jgi:hypothetical protein